LGFFDAVIETSLVMMTIKNPLQVKILAPTPICTCNTMLTQT